MNSWSVLRWLAGTWLKPRWVELTAAMVCAALSAGLTATAIYLLDPVVRRVITERRPADLVGLPLLVVAVALARALAQVTQGRLVNRVGNEIVGAIQSALFSRLIRSDLAQLRKRHSGAYLSSVIYDAALVREALTTGIVNYTQNALQVAATFAVMLYEDAFLTLLVLVVAPVAVWVMGRSNKRSRQAASGAMEATSDLSSAMMESLNGFEAVKVDNRERFEEARVAGVIRRREAHIIRGANARVAAGPSSEALVTIATAVVIAYAGWRGLGLGPLLVFLGSLAAMSQSLRQIANLQAVIAEGVTAGDRLNKALDVEPAIRDAADAKPLRIDQATIRFDRVSFAYDAMIPALTDVSLTATRGETIALVGPSGGGKSTILKLIPRFYEVGAGALTIDGQDVRAVTIASLRDRIALVAQEPFLFDDTVRANIAYSRPDASEAEIEAAAHMAAAHDFIVDLPDGYATSVGEAGAKLSAGQRQRIAIARAFLKNAPILLLDEATSALDAESEIKVQDALERLMAGRTTILIAHRLSTVRKADRIYVIDRGCVVEAGDHQSLVANDGLYARLVRAQTLDTIETVDRRLGEAPNPSGALAGA